MIVKILESLFTTKKHASVNVCLDVNAIVSILGMIILPVDVNANIQFLVLNQDSLVGKAVAVNASLYAVQRDILKAHKAVCVLDKLDALHHLLVALKVNIGIQINVLVFHILLIFANQ